MFIYTHIYSSLSGTTFIAPKYGHRVDKYELLSAVCCFATQTCVLTKNKTIKLANLILVSPFVRNKWQNGKAEYIISVINYSHTYMHRLSYAHTKQIANNIVPTNT